MSAKSSYVYNNSIFWEYSLEQTADPGLNKTTNPYIMDNIGMPLVVYQKSHVYFNLAKNGFAIRCSAEDIIFGSSGDDILTGSSGDVIISGFSSAYLYAITPSRTLFYEVFTSSEPFLEKRFSLDLVMNLATFSIFTLSQLSFTAAYIVQPWEILQDPPYMLLLNATHNTNVEKIILHNSERSNTNETHITRTEPILYLSPIKIPYILGDYDMGAMINLFTFPIFTFSQLSFGTAAIFENDTNFKEEQYMSLENYNPSTLTAELENNFNNTFDSMCINLNLIPGICIWSGMYEQF